MEDPVLAVALLVSLGVVAAIVCHFLTKNYLYASTATAFSASVAVQIINYIHLGYLDPFFIFAFLSTVLGYFVLALFIGIPFAIIRKRKGERILIPLARKGREAKPIKKGDRGRNAHR